MQEMASITRGRMVKAEEIQRLIKEIRDLPVPPPMETRILLWSNPYTLSILILLLTLFWIGRKLNGTIETRISHTSPAGVFLPSLPVIFRGLPVRGSRSRLRKSQPQSHFFQAAAISPCTSSGVFPSSKQHAPSRRPPHHEPSNSF